MSRGSENSTIGRLPGYETGSFIVAEIPVSKYEPAIKVGKSIKKHVTKKTILITVLSGVIIFVVIPAILIIGFLIWFFK